MRRSLSMAMAMVMVVITVFVVGCDNKKSSGYTKEQIIEKYSRYIPRDQIEALLDGETGTNANAAVLNLVRYGVSNEFDRDIANMK